MSPLSFLRISSPMKMKRTKAVIIRNSCFVLFISCRIIDISYCLLDYLYDTTVYIGVLLHIKTILSDDREVDKSII